MSSCIFAIIVNLKITLMGWGCSSVEHLPNTYNALDLISRTAKKIRVSELFVSKILVIYIAKIYCEKILSDKNNKIV